ncbi:hypothetical protein [Flavobacterium sp. C4GT6]|uniref:hypothetical protein n=1 Tax=Flavobacterium sp. C4GT6 TaxID=3103818 RepID=UPI002ED136F7
MIEIKKIANNKGSIALGAGLVALDVIVNGTPETPAKLCAGGSCGNVLSILSFLGWESKPIARLANNEASDRLFNDFENFNVNTSLISKSEDGRTPVIIHRILKDKLGNPKHKFEFKVPNTNIWLPSYKPVLTSSVHNLIENQEKTNVFYFDRVSRSIIELAKHYKNGGALIVFEPSSLKEDQQFLECLSLADIIKFSNDRIKNYSSKFPYPNSLLEIETMGKEGLRYRLKSDSNPQWKLLSPYEFKHTVDNAGAGDWCTAGIINQLGYNGVKSFLSSSREEIENSLSIGQIFGGINCTYNGARGLMYNMNYQSLIKISEAIINENKVIPEIEQNNINILTIQDFDFESIL